MTREEVIETLKRVCAAFDQKTLDSIASQVHHEHVEKNLKRELELAKSYNSALRGTLADKESQLAAKDRELVARDEEIKSLKAELADSRHSEESLKAEKYAGRSKRGLGKSRSTSRGRDDNKDDFDGTPESAPQTDANEASEGRSGDDAPVSLTQIRKAKASRPSKYTLADAAVIFCDETWGRLHLMDATRKVYCWIVGNKKKKAVVYVYDDGSRGRKVIVSILEGRDVKAVHTDGYNAYYFLSDIGIVHICCGAHVWRKIKEWFDRTGDPEARALLLDLAELFMMDARLREAAAPPEEVLRQRNSPKTLDTISRFTARVDLLLEKCKEIPKIGSKALNYAREVAAKVFRWREDPDYELDNNFAEQSARPFATARKTSLFHCSHEGAGNDCVIRLFIETCRLRGVSVTGWFKAYFNAILNGRTDYSNLLPGVLAID